MCVYAGLFFLKTCLVKPTYFLNLFIDYKSECSYGCVNVYLCVCMCLNSGVVMLDANSVCRYSWWMYANRSQWHWLAHCATRNAYGLVLHSNHMRHFRESHRHMRWYEFIFILADSLVSALHVVPSLSNLSLSTFPSTLPPSLRVFEANGRDRLTPCTIDGDG